MRTIWAFLVILYAAAHTASVSSTSVPTSPANSTPQQTVVLPSAASERATRQLQPTQNNSSQASMAPRLTKEQIKANRDSIFNFHHGTLATRVPLHHGNKTPIFGWHTTVYMAVGSSYEQICGGSLVKKDTAISAAHCFWDEAGLIPAEQFAVAVGQARRRWQDVERYRSNVSEIVVPPRFLGGTTNFQDDIAVVRLATPVDYQFGVRPVCVDFGLFLERSHLREGSLGLITGFGLTTENGVLSEALNYQQLPYVDIRNCIAASDPGFLKYLTSDKICAGDQKTGRALCRGDSGGGLLFFYGLIETAIMYLRGVASAAARNNNACNAYAIGSFTHVWAHRTFLREAIPGLEEECKTAYPAYAPKPVQADNKTGNNDSITNVSTERPGNTGTPATSSPGLQEVTEAPVKSKPGVVIVPIKSQPFPDWNSPNEQQVVTQAPVKSKPGVVIVDVESQPFPDWNLPNEQQVVTQAPVEGNAKVVTASTVKPEAADSNLPNEMQDVMSNPDNPIDLHGLVNAANPSSSIPNKNEDAGTGLLREVKVRPNTNLYFITGPVLDPSRFYGQAGAAPVVVNSNPVQPTNIYVIIQN